MPALENKKRERFCQEYVIDHNGRQAAIRAGYSEKTANEQAAQLLAILNIKARVEELDLIKCEELEITHARILREIALVAFARSSDLMEYVEQIILEDDESDGEPKQKKVTKTYLKPYGELNKDLLAAISAIKDGPNGVEIKLHDKLKALEHLAKIRGLLKDKPAVELNVSLDEMPPGMAEKINGIKDNKGS